MAQSRRRPHVPRDADGHLARFIGPERYPVFYTDTENHFLCQACAEDLTILLVVTLDFWSHLEPGDDPLPCDNCGTIINDAEATP